MKLYAVEIPGEQGYEPIGISDSYPVAKKKCEEYNKEVNLWGRAIVTEYTIGKNHWTNFEG